MFIEIQLYWVLCWGEIKAYFYEHLSHLSTSTSNTTSWWYFQNNVKDNTIPLPGNLFKSQLFTLALCVPFRQIFSGFRRNVSTRNFPVISRREAAQISGFISPGSQIYFLRLVSPNGGGAGLDAFNSTVHIVGLKILLHSSSSSPALRPAALTDVKWYWRARLVLKFPAVASALMYARDLHINIQFRAQHMRCCSDNVCQQ